MAIFAFFWPVVWSISAAEFEMCPGLRFEENELIKFNKTERSLICGNNQLEGWQNLPVSQKRLLAERFLQQRGYHKPQFVEQSPGILIVKPGERTRITHIRAQGLPEEFKSIYKKRGIVGSVLTPEKLDELSNWIKSELQTLGYGCPQIDIQANPEGEIKLSVKPGPIHLISDITRPEISGLDSKIYTRYEAFHLGERLNNRILTLSGLRLMREDLFLSAFYDLQCSADQSLKIVQRVVPVKPRLISVGLGIDTEGLLRGRVRWKHSRIGEKASNIEAQINASFVEQSAEVFMNWFLLEPASRFYLIPRSQLIRYSEAQFESVKSRTLLSGALSYDYSPLAFNFSYGPAFEFVDTRKGEGPRRAHFMSFIGDLQIKTHDFEYFLSNPQEGWVINLQSYSRFENVYADSTFHRFLVDTTALWNLGQYDPAYLVLGWRTNFGSFWLPHRDQYQIAVPPDLRFFLGGDQNLRGFDRKELPKEGREFQSFFYNGFELRSVSVIPYGIEPLLFFDTAWVGEEFLRLSYTTYASPGLGVRWASKIGVFRGTASHGFVWKTEEIKPNTHWQFFLSYGQEF